MSVATEISRLQTAKANIKSSIENKGVSVPSNALISTYSGYIDQITGGGSGTTIPYFDNAYNLFYKNRFSTIKTDLLNKFNGSYVGYLYAGANSSSEAYTIYASDISSWSNKALSNGANNGDHTINLSNMISGGYVNVDSNDNDVTIDASAYDFQYASTIDLSSAFVNYNATYKLNDVTINLIPTTSSYIPMLRTYIYRWTFTGNLKLYAYLSSGSSFTPFNYEPDGYFEEFHLIPYSNITLNFTNMSTSFIDENTLINSIALYTATEMTNKSITIRLNSTLYASLQQTTIDDASAVNITFTT